MPPEPTGVEQAISRTLRDNLEKLQRTADELHQAVADLVSACASSRPTNSLPPMLRAQTAAASLAAALDVLSRFVTGALSSQRAAIPFAPEPEVLPVVSLPQSPAPAEPSMPPPRLPTPMGEPRSSDVQPSSHAGAPPALKSIEPPAPVTPPEFSFSVPEPPAFVPEPEPVVERMAAFDLMSLSPDEQELHRRANRVAKVCMQDIQMLRPQLVREGREHKDICVRLRDDIEKAHKEYERRFFPILGHPVDYFYHWMVEILAGGDPQVLGEYPYPTPVLRR